MASILSLSDVPQSEIDALDGLQRSLPEGSELGKALGKMRDGLRDGADLTIARDDDELTTSKAASILGVSRTHLYKLLDAGLIPFHVVGERSRRMYMSDVRQFHTEVSKFRAADAISIAKRDQLEDDVFDSMD